jgi:cytochrome c peroxidase
MTRRVVAAALGVGLGLVACKGSRDAPAPRDKPEPELQPRRPSDGPLAQMPHLQLPDDPSRAAKIELGHRLFFDKRLSGDGDRACDGCHTNGTAPALWNVGYYVESFYSDGRAATLEQATRSEWGGPAMGAAADTLDTRAAALAAMPAYKKLFIDAFGDKTQVKADQVAAAISEYVRTLICVETAYDRLAAGEKGALTEQQKKGFDVFAGKGGCVTCHAPPYFTTAMGVAGGAYFNVGIGTKGVAEAAVDTGRMKVTNDPAHWAAFKPPTLRNITKSAPYFHDGSVATLDAAVRLMASGGIANKNLNPALVDRQLTDAEIADVIAFLAALDCPGSLVAP